MGRERALEAFVERQQPKVGGDRKEQEAKVASQHITGLVVRLRPREISYQAGSRDDQRPHRELRRKHSKQPNNRRPQVGRSWREESRGGVGREVGGGGEKVD